MADSKPTSAAAIVGLVLGILAIVTSWIPIVNNLSFILGAIGLIFSIVGVIGRDQARCDHPGAPRVQPGGRVRRHRRGGRALLAR